MALYKFHIIIIVIVIIIIIIIKAVFSRKELVQPKSVPKVAVFENLRD